MAAAFDGLRPADTAPWRSASPRCRYQRRKRDALVALLPPGRRFRRALDLGCGTGAMAVRLAAGVADEVLGTDVTAAAVALARGRCRGLPNLRFAQGDARAPDAALAGRFDLVVAADVLYHLPPLLDDAALGRLAARVAAPLAPGGLLLLANHFFAGHDPDSRLSRRIHDAFRRSPVLRPLGPTNRRAFHLADLLERAPPS